MQQAQEFVQQRATTTTSTMRCAIFFYEGYVGVAPSIVSLASALAAEGHAVTIYATPTPYADVGELDAKITIAYLPRSRLLGRLGRSRFGRLAKVGQGASVSWFALRALTRELASYYRSSVPTSYVGVDGAGALAAKLSATLLRRAYAYLSLELDLAHTMGDTLAKAAYAGATCVVIQGNDRLEALARRYAAPPKRVFILPNAPYAASKTPPSARRSFFGDTSGRRVALQAGMINDVSCSAKLAAAFADIPGWVLVLHERQRRSPQEAYLQALSARNRVNLLLSLEPVRYQDLDRVFSSADVGLAFYETALQSVNYSLISSSGKLPQYLKHGKPVLVSNLPAFVDLVGKYGCGVVIEDPANSAEIAAALTKIAADYDRFSQNARLCFAAEFDFAKSAAPLRSFLEESARR